MPPVPSRRIRSSTGKSELVNCFAEIHDSCVFLPSRRIGRPEKAARKRYSMAISDADPPQFKSHTPALYLAEAIRKKIEMYKIVFRDITKSRPQRTG